MEVMMELGMAVSLCCAVGCMLHRFAVNRGGSLAERVTVSAIGLGFVFGTVWKALLNPVPWTIEVYIAGAWLCYAAVVFSYAGREEKVCE